MSYIIKAFGNLIVPPYLRPGDSQDLGTGAALTSFLQLPGGGYYDNYQDKKSPQGIRPISKSGIFIGTDSELRTQLDAWRAMMGRRERLTIEYDDGALRWQWARLQDVSTPRTKDDKKGWLPFTFTWITAAQNWRGTTASDWTWGDGSWAFGDGSAEFGVGSYTYPLTGSGVVSVYHGGSIYASNVVLRLDVPAAWEDVTIVNETTGQTIAIDRASATARPWIEIDSGARTIYLARKAPVPVDLIWRVGNFVHVRTADVHGLTTTVVTSGIVAGDPFRLEGVGDYDGTYYPAWTEGTSQFYFVVPGDFEPYETRSGGSMTGLFNLYGLATISDRKRWFSLAPGYNTLRVEFSGTIPAAATLTVEFTDHHG